MIKIFISVRNRLAITVKCLHALKNHSTIKHKIYVYDNSTNHLLDQHFNYFYKMYSKGLISQITFTSKDSTFDAFSKASTCNFWGLQHEQDPLKDKYNFLVMLDNDIIVTPNWDAKLHEAWKYVAKNNLQHVKVIGQLPGGIKNKTEHYDIEDMKGIVGKLGGSGLWSVRPNFFSDIGLLDLKKLVGHDKRHDQEYWRLLEMSTKGKNYIMGLNQKLGIHCGRNAGSVCNVLTRQRNNKNKNELIKFEKPEENISNMTFDEFYKLITGDKQLANDW